MDAYTLIDDIKEELDHLASEESEEIVEDRLAASEDYDVSEGERALIKELFFVYEIDEDQAVQKRRLNAMDLYQRTIDGEYDDWDIELDPYYEEEIEEEFLDLSDTNNTIDDDPLVFLVARIVQRSRNDGESFWITYVSNPRAFDQLSKDEKNFILAAIGRETDSADDSLPDLMAKTLKYLE